MPSKHRHISTWAWAASLAGLTLFGCQDPSAQRQTQAREHRIAETLARLEAMEAERPARLDAAGPWIENQYQGDIAQTQANRQRIRDMNARAEANWAQRAPRHRRTWEKQWARNPHRARRVAIDMLY